MTREELINKLISSDKKEDKERLGQLIQYGDIYGYAYKMSQFNDLLKGIRNNIGMSQDEFSKKIGIERSTLSRYETGERAIPLDVIDKVLDEFSLKLVLKHRNEAEEEYMMEMMEDRNELIKELLTENDTKENKDI